MKRVLWLAVLVLAGCGAGDPPASPSGMDLTRVWSGTL